MKLTKGQTLQGNNPKSNRVPWFEKSINVLEFKSKKTNKEKLVLDYLRLIYVLLPLAANNDWVIKNDHCFARVVLDNLVRGKWSDLIKDPAYKNLNEEQLEKAIVIAKSLVDIKLLRELNYKSLEWRRAQTN